MFTYKIVKHEDTENGTLYALYETAEETQGEIAEGGEEQVVVMGQSPVNSVFYESLDELVEHVTDLYNYVKQVESGEQKVVDSDDVTFVEMEEEGCGCDCNEEGCEDCCGDDCDCNKGGERVSFNDETGNPIEKKDHPNMKDGQCCGGSCGCKN